MKDKIYLLLLFILFGCVGALFFTQTSNNKIAYVDTSKLLGQSKKIQLLKNKLSEEQTKIKSNIDTLAQELQNALKEYERKSITMTNKEKILYKESLNHKQAELIQYQKSVGQSVMAKEHKEMEILLTSINSSIKDYGIKNNFKIIFATSSGNIAYADDSIDITSEIIKIINN